MDKKGETAELKTDLEAKMTATPTKARPGTNVVFTITLKNIGKFSASNLRVKDDLPNGVKYVSDSLNGIASNNGVEWQNLGSIDPGGQKTLVLTACIDGSEPNGPWINRANIFGDSPGGKFSATCFFEIRSKSRLYEKRRGISGESKGISGWSISGWSKLGKGP
jgi:uncharacterized repeat protein (TIGR01451 family)